MSRTELLLLTALLFSAAVSKGGDVIPPPLPNLPDIVPDLVAMVKAEKPVGAVEALPVEDLPSEGTGDVGEIYSRQQQGDRDECVRLYQQYADAHPGTPEACTALFRIANAFPVRYAEKCPMAKELARIGDIALRLADEGSRANLSLRVFFMFVRESVNARTRTKSKWIDAEHAVEVASPDRVEPSPEEWIRIFRVAAILAGRFPDDLRGPQALLLLAKAIYPSPRGQARALELLRFLSESASDWDVRFEAFKALHDDALNRGDRAVAEEVAGLAARSCGGRLRIPRDERAKTKGAEVAETPWQTMQRLGRPSEGKVLLEVPPWAEGTRVVSRVKWESYDAKKQAWTPWPADRHDAKDILREVYLFAKCADGTFLAGASSTILSSIDTGRLRGSEDLLGLIGTWSKGWPSETNLLFLPSFPVREGLSVLPFANTLARQEARLDGETVEVTLRAGTAVWVQRWRPRQRWYDWATVEAEAFDLYEAETARPIPGPYDLDPQWHMRKYRVTVETVAGRPEAPPDIAAETEKRILEGLWPSRLDEALRAIAWERIAVRFEGAKLEVLRNCWFPKPEATRAELEAVRLSLEKDLERVRALTGKEPQDANPSFTHYALRWFWAVPQNHQPVPHPPKVEITTTYSLKDARVEREGAVVRLFVEDNGGRCWLLGVNREELGRRERDADPSLHTSDRFGTGRKAIGERQGLRFLREADRIVALDAEGKERWRHVVPVEKSLLDKRERAGLPLLADPQLVACPAGERIVCGVGQRAVTFGMGVFFSPLGGGLLALDLEGRVLWQKNVGHCVALTALPRGERGAVAGLFLPPSQPPYVGDSKPQPWFVAAFDPADGKEIWRIETPGRTAWGEVETFYPFRENDRAGVVVSLDRVRVISSDGEQLFESKPEGERAQHKVVAVTDLDGDRRDEIVVCSGAYPSYGGRLQILDLKGKPLWASPEKDRWAFAACEDLDGDGWKELVVKSNVPIPGVGVFGLKPEERK